MMLRLQNSRHQEKPRPGWRLAIVASLIFLSVQGCAPQRPYRKPVPTLPGKPELPPVPPPTISPGPELSNRPMPPDPKIREQDLKTKEKAPPVTTSKEISPPSAIPETLSPTKPPLADDSSLLAKIMPGTPPQRAASLRLSEEGRKLLDGGEYAKALTRLERAISIDSTNAYGHFLLAKTQFGLRRYNESLNFLDVAEARLGAEPFWLSEVYALRGENFRALGMAAPAEENYEKALTINPGNRTAAEALARKHPEPQPPQR